MVQAALVMGLSERQCYRVKARVGKAGAKGVVHGNRGRRCKRKTKEKTVRRVVELARGKYQGFNDHHLTEKLKEQEQIELSREKVRRILRAEGIVSPRKRRGIKHRSRRERRASEGMMLQVDGSPHDWLQGRGPRLCLIGAIDDATNKVMGAFFTTGREFVGLFHAVLLRPFGNTAYRSRSIATVIRYSGPTGNRRSMNSWSTKGRPPKWAEA